MRPRPLVIYHANCFDGFTAAWVFNKFYKQRATMVDPEPEYFPAHYGSEPPDTSGREVYILDFSYPREQTLKLILASNRTVIYDHHKTAESDLHDLQGELRSRFNVNRQNDKVVFDMGRSGASITYDELLFEAGKRSGTHKPKGELRALWLVDYVEDRDLWRNRLPNTREFSAYLATVTQTFEEWDKVLDRPFSESVRDGAAILAYIQQYGELAIKNVRNEEIGGVKVPTMNISYQNCSDHLNMLLEKKPEAKFAASYFKTAKGDWQFSLRSRGDVDVSEIAKLYGGGGHFSAAGFKVEVLPWEDAEEAVE